MQICVSCVCVCCVCVCIFFSNNWEFISFFCRILSHCLPAGNTCRSVACRPHLYLSMMFYSLQSTFKHISLVYFQNSPMRLKRQVMLFLFYCWGKQGSWKVNDLSKVRGWLAGKLWFELKLSDLKFNTSFKFLGFSEEVSQISGFSVTEIYSLHLQTLYFSFG